MGGENGLIGRTLRLNESARQFLRRPLQEAKQLSNELKI